MKEKALLAAFKLGSCMHYAFQLTTCSISKFFVPFLHELKRVMLILAGIPILFACNKPCSFHGAVWCPKRTNPKETKFAVHFFDLPQRMKNMLFGVVNHTASECSTTPDQCS